MTSAGEEKAFLRAILAEPGDDTARLVYADWLDEKKGGDRGAGIRWMVGNPKESWVCLCGHHGTTAKCTTCVSMGPAVECIPRRGDGESHYVVRRGFVAEVRLTSEAFLGGPCQNCQYWAWDGSRTIEQAHSHCHVCWGKKIVTPGLAAAIFAAHPVQTVVLTTVPQLSVGVVRKVEERYPAERVRLMSAYWTVAGPGLAQQRVGISYWVSDQEVMAQDRMCRQEFHRRVEDARRPENTLKAWWPKVTFRVESQAGWSIHQNATSTVYGEYSPPLPNVGG